MNRRVLYVLLIPPALALTGFAVAQAPRPGDKGKGADKAAEKAKADHHKVIAAAIKKDGKLPKHTYWTHAEKLRGAKSRNVAALPLNHAKSAGKVSALTATTKSSLIVVGGKGLPDGFGSGFQWDRADNEVLLVMFINAADPLGVSIDGLQAGDQVQIMSASGIASFKQDKGNSTASSLVGVVAAGAQVAATALGYPEVAPVITAAEAFAKDQFKATNVRILRRDPFGVDPGSGRGAAQEGGMLVCMPEAGGTFYSGEDRKRWIQGDGTRSDEHLPSHFNYTAFFPRQGYTTHNTRICQQSGQMFVLAWDWQFDDNAGFYKVFVKLTKGNGLPPPIILRKQAK